MQQPQGPRQMTNTPKEFPLEEDFRLLLIAHRVRMDNLNKIEEPAAFLRTLLRMSGEVGKQVSVEDTLHNTGQQAAYRKLDKEILGLLVRLGEENDVIKSMRRKDD